MKKKVITSFILQKKLKIYIFGCKKFSELFFSATTLLSLATQPAFAPISKQEWAKYLWGHDVPSAVYPQVTFWEKVSPVILPNLQNRKWVHTTEACLPGTQIQRKCQPKLKSCPSPQLLQEAPQGLSRGPFPRLDPKISPILSDSHICPGL